jgi:hypothetical protein
MTDFNLIVGKSFVVLSLEKMGVDLGVLVHLHFLLDLLAKLIFQ